jgi:glucan phosphoethanolaminetransferase (alkaline phosphatase superfamily)
MKGKTITATTTSLSTIVYIVTALMLSTSIIYFVVASQSYSELSKIASQSSIDKEAMSEIMGITNELIFFTIVGIAYILVGFWMIKSKYHSKIPYIVAITGSAALIVFYIATRTVSLPTIGLESDIGITDTVSKILQGAIIVGSLFVLRLSKRLVTIDKMK